MRFGIGLLAAIVLLCGTRIASAEPRSISVQSGWSTPVGDLANGAGEGVYGGVSANQPIGDQEQLFLDVNYLALRDQTTDLWPGYLAVRENVRITETAVGLRAMLTPPRVPISPYLKFGVALEFVDPEAVFETSYQSVHLREPQFMPGFLAGAGVSVPLSESAGLRLEGMFHLIASDSTAIVGTVGMSFWTRFALR